MAEQPHTVSWGCSVLRDRPSFEAGMVDGVKWDTLHTGDMPRAEGKAWSLGSQVVHAVGRGAGCIEAC